MSIFVTTLNQTSFLFGLIVIGYILIKLKVLPENSATVLSKLENNVFIPALVLKTFIENFTVERISVAWQLFVGAFLVAFLMIPFSILVSKLTTKDGYIQRIYTYGLTFSNFSFMGNAIVSSLFPDIFFEYLIFTLPLWMLIYLWGVPKLLLYDSKKKQTLRDSLKSFLNPMFAAMILGMIIGLCKVPLPSFLESIVSVSANCMSPVAMLLTGIAISFISLKKTFTNLNLYLISGIKLLVMPFLLIGLTQFVTLPETLYICILNVLAMPFGLNTIVIPSAEGKDTTVAAGLAVVSHLLSCVTIPLVFIML
ncbi:MAG: AEC family transporter [Clostridia bacterium]|nr:AEC family transporter [Clostridia bacterium]